MTDEDATDFYVASMFGQKSQRPLVSVKLLDVALQVTPTKAREMGAMLVEAAAAAECDGFLVTWLATLGAGFDERARAMMMAEFREYRTAMLARDAQEEGGRP